jgi:colanic acid/amylovoran biosynthesis glycosyltransferase
MKIAFITESFPERSETFILGKVGELKKRGHQVTVFTQFKRDHQVHPDILAPLDLHRDVVRLPVWDRVRPKDLARALAGAGPGILFPPRLGAALKNSWSVLALVKVLPFLRERYDIIHVHYAYMGRRWLEAANSGAPLVASLLGHDLTYTRTQYESGYKDLFGKASRLFASSQYLARLAVEAGADPDRVTVLYPEVDDDFFGLVDRKGRGGGRLRLVTVGRLDWTKGYVYALEAVRALTQRGVDCAYRIVGEGSARHEVELAIADLGLTERVTLLGSRDREGCREELDGADIFILASVTESFGLAAAEAMATGLPVVATQVGGLPEVVDDGVTGYLVPPRDPQALADQVQVLAQDPTLRADMGRRARERVLAHFNRRRIIDQLLSSYQEVIAEGKTP